MLNPRIAGLLVATALLTAGSSFADSSATMKVSVQVIARAIVSVDGAPDVIQITDADIAVGYVDVVNPIVVRVRSNSRAGYLLQANNTSAAFSRIELTGGTALMNVRSEAWIQRPYSAAGEVMPLHARLHLAPGTAAGPHAMPVAFTASPL